MIDPLLRPPLKPELFQILLALEEGPLHGYGIMKRVEDNTGGLVLLEPSPLYRRLRRLLDADVLEECEEAPPDSHDERRRYYRLTDAGRRLLAAEARRLVELAGRERVRRLAARALRESET